MSQQKYRVVETNVEQMEKEIRRHRLRILRVIVLAVVLGLGISAGIIWFYETKEYSEYQVVESIGRQDSAGTEVMEFQGNILKYSNDGIVYADTKNQVIWNQAYEMKVPLVDTCEDYVAVADQEGKKIYVMDLEGPCGEIETNHIIQQIHVANQGMVAVLMEEEGTGFIQLYDKKGSFLAEGELHTKNNGYPLDIAISNDGKKLAVSMLDLNEGDIKTRISFYNFGTVGQNEIDNMVSTYLYDGMVIPKIEFLTNDLAVAVGDVRMIFYEGTQKPTTKQEIEINQEIKSLFYNDDYVGIVFEDVSKDDGYQTEIFDVNGDKIQTIAFEMEYTEIDFLNNDEICIRNEQECSIYTLRGIHRYHHKYEKDIYEVMHHAGRHYIVIMSDFIERIKLN